MVAVFFLSPLSQTIQHRFEITRLLANICNFALSHQRRIHSSFQSKEVVSENKKVGNR